MSPRNITTERPVRRRRAAAEPPRGREDAVLDATYESIMAVGVRRTTVADVARRAGVSRMTVYRAFPDAASLLWALLQREFGAVMQEGESRAAGAATGRERVIEASAHVVEGIATHPLWSRLVDVDPELLLPYVIDRLGGTQRMGRERIERVIAEGIADGSIAARDARDTALAVVLAAQGLVFSWRMAEAELGRAGALAQLRAMVAGCLDAASAR